jgi:NitT/TauT family transport system permease protein/taurine transport system permease protein
MMRPRIIKALEHFPEKWMPVFRRNCDHLKKLQHAFDSIKSKRALVIAAVAVALWEAIVRLGLVNQIILAAPSDIVLAAANDGDVFLRAFATTMIEIGAAILIAWTLGIILGVVVGSSHALAAAAAPVLSSIFAIPLIILYPLLMAWFGIGPLSKVVFAVLSGFFPIALNTIDGVRAIERRYIVFARSVGATRLQTYARIVFPLALPAMVSGLRVGTGLVVIGVIVTEMLASLGGIGFLISYHRTLFNTGHVYFGMLLALVIAVAVNIGLTWLDRRIGLWRMREQAEG